MAILVLWGTGVVLLPRPRGGPARVFLAALAVRALLLASPPALSDDLYRYLWEGRVSLLGGNPYLHPPASEAWAAHGADPVLQLVNHPEVSSIYPPVALWLFGILGALAYDPLVIKAFMGLCDAAVAGVLASIRGGRGLALGGAWLYALHPLGAVESAGSGHLEAVALLCLVLALRAWDRGGSGLGWAGLGALLKLLPGVLLGVLWRRSPWLILPVALLGLVAAWPFLEAGELLGRGLDTYARHWSFNAGAFAVLEAALGSWARPVAVGLGALVSAAALWRFRDPARVMLWVGGAFVLLSPTVHPWYVLWAWVPALVLGVRAWTVLATLVPVSYAALASYDPVTSRWEEPAWPVWVQLMPFLAALLWECWQGLIRPGPWESGGATSPSASPSPTPPGPSGSTLPSPP